MTNKGKMSYTTLVFLSLCHTSALAAHDSFLQTWLSPMIVSLSAGPSWSDDHETHTFYLTPTIEKTYVGKNNSSDYFGNSELFVGTRKALRNNLEGRIGVALGITSPAKLKGKIWDDASPMFDNYSYHYDLQHARLAFKGIFLFNVGFKVTPWVSGSAGIAFNRASNFSNTPLIPEAVESPNFRDYTNIDFTYTLGVGIETQLQNNWHVGGGIEFADWGKSHLDRARDQTLGTGLSQSHFRTKTVLLNVTYVM